jgi:ABC-type nitrate/sulfonate/bicarbonate transport system ATPase subunit
MANAIEIEGLRKTYAAQGSEPPKEALKGIDLAIPAGSIFGLLGPNGAGKSTLINILAGLVTKTAGRVSIWGFDQDVNPRQSRAAIGVMPQETNLDPFFTPRGSLDVQAGLYGVPRRERRTDEILAMIGLTDKADSYARNLSGGMRLRRPFAPRRHVLRPGVCLALVDVALVAVAAVDPAEIGRDLQPHPRVPQRSAAAVAGHPPGRDHLALRRIDGTHGGVVLGGDLGHRSSPGSAEWDNSDRA